MKTHRNGLIVLALILSHVGGACSVLPASPSNPVIPGLPATLAVQTIAARSDLSGLVFSPTPPPASDMPAPTDTPSPPLVSMHTLAPTNTQAPRLTSIYASSIQDLCFNAAEFIKDVTFPDRTFVKPGQKFTKIWQLKNIGTCTWTSSYELVYVWGDQMKGVSPKPLGKTIAPGLVIEIGVDLVAPLSPGAYHGDWMLQDAKGNRFGTGYKARAQFWVAINVGVPGIPDYLFCPGGG